MVLKNQVKVGTVLTQNNWYEPRPVPFYLVVEVDQYGIIYYVDLSTMKRKKHGFGLINSWYGINKVC
jgi:hypothetical protein